MYQQKKGTKQKRRFTAHIREKDNLGGFLTDVILHKLVETLLMRLRKLLQILLKAQRTM